MAKLIPLVDWQLTLYSFNEDIVVGQPPIRYPKCKIVFPEIGFVL